MRALFLLTILLLTATTPASTQTPQDPSITATHVIGEVKSVDAAGKQLTVKTDAGSVVTAVLSDSTAYLRVPPGETTLAKATKVTLAEIGEGDRVLANGKVADDHKTISSRQVVVMSKADIAKKQEQERQEWRRRGILGVISAVKPDAKEIIITTSNRNPTGPPPQPVIIPVSDNVDLKRYAPDSIKFSDAKSSSFSELQVGDQVRALGEKSPDGTHFTPEKLVTGAFRTVVGTVTAVDAATGEIKINDLQTKKTLFVVVKNDSVLRKFELGGGMMMGGGRGPGPGAPGNAQVAPAPQGTAQTGNKPPQAGGGAAPGAGGPGGGGRFGGGGFNIQDMLERMPTISLADVKQGDTIIVSSTKGADPTRLTAITLVNGAETILAMLAPRPQGQAATPNPAAGLGSGINFGIGLP